MIFPGADEWEGAPEGGLYQQMNNPPVWEGLADVLDIEPNHEVLHLANGAGDITCVLAKRVLKGPGHVHALDFANRSHELLRRKIKDPTEITRMYSFYFLNDEKYEPIIQKETGMNGPTFFTNKCWSNSKMLENLQELLQYGKLKEPVTWLLEDAKARGEISKKIIFSRQSAGAMTDYPDGSQDRILTFESIPILDDSAGTAWIKEVIRVAKPNCNLLFAGWGFEQSHVKPLKDAGFKVKLEEDLRVKCPFLSHLVQIPTTVLCGTRKT